MRGSLDLGQDTAEPKRGYGLGYRDRHVGAGERSRLPCDSPLIGRNDPSPARRCGSDQCLFVHSRCHERCQMGKGAHFQVWLIGVAQHEAQRGVREVFPDGLAPGKDHGERPGLAFEQARGRACQFLLVVGERKQCLS